MTAFTNSSTWLFLLAYLRRLWTTEIRIQRLPQNADALAPNTPLWTEGGVSARFPHSPFFAYYTNCFVDWGRADSALSTKRSYARGKYAVVDCLFHYAARPHLPLHPPNFSGFVDG
ncbi:hypothetical protein CGL51_03580 [Pyrobaculum aerophilum]|uniref:Uncharacterized protein n=2 Tax=Pyrobaculum aerophilum TaxID=13773 RepID=A0A371R1J1_9CREN|nr:hypothetical protein CGL51_03580 [Pyrobaculum aerophilum]